ncbi:MAG: hypothetical protein RSA65_09815 [Clostridia bacterium]
MKKWMALATILVLVFSCALAGAEAAPDVSEYVASNGYDLLYVTDIFINEDSEVDAAVDKVVYVQGCFGTIDMSKGEAEAANIGFDENDTFTLSLAKDCVVLMPKDWTNPVENVQIDDPQLWCEALMEAAAKASFEKPDGLDFYATFEFNEAGELTKLTYDYLP